MGTIGQAIDRAQVFLQDEDAMAWSRDAVRRAILAEVTRLARMYLFGEITWVQGVAEQGRYTPPPAMFMVAEAIYDGQSLRPVTEASLRRVTETWERETDQRPYWFTQTEQPLTTDDNGRPVIQVEVAPAPVITGSEIPVSPGMPLMMPLEFNLVLCGWVDPQPSTAEETTLNVPDVVAQIAIYKAVSELSNADGDFQDQQKAEFFHVLADVMLKALVP